MKTVSGLVWIGSLWTLMAGWPLEASHSGKGITDSPKDGDAVVYYDIDARGRLLEIDYAQQRARVLAQVPMDTLIPSGRLWGWFLPEDRFAYLFLRDAERTLAPNSLFALDVRRGTFSDSGWKEETHGDYTFIPVDSERFVFQIGRARKGILNARTGAVKSDVDFDLLHAMTRVSEDGTRIYAACGYKDPTISRVDAHTGKTIDKHTTTQFLGPFDEDTFAGPRGIIEPYVMVRFWRRGGGRGQYVLLDIESDKVAASEDIGKGWSGERSLIRLDTGQLLFTRVGETLELSKYRPTGTVHRMRIHVDENQFEELDPITYDPHTHIALRSGPEDFVVLPRYRFDYATAASLFEDNETFQGPPASHEDRQRRIEIIEERLKQQLGESITDKHFTYETRHLDIVEPTAE